MACTEKALRREIPQAVRHGSLQLFPLKRLAAAQHAETARGSRPRRGRHYSRYLRAAQARSAPRPAAGEVYLRYIQQEREAAALRRSRPHPGGFMTSQRGPAMYDEPRDGVLAVYFGDRGNSAVSAKPMRVFTDTRIGQAAKISARMPSSAARSRSMPEPLCFETTVLEGSRH